MTTINETNIATIKCKGYTLCKNTENQNNPGYILDVIIKTPADSACDKLSKLLAEKKIYAKFDDGNYTRLSKTEIEQIVDPMLVENFGENIKRASKIGCTVKVRPSIASRILDALGSNTMFDCEQIDNVINIFNLKTNIKEADEFLSENFGLVRCNSAGVIFNIKDVENVTQTPAIKQLNVNFSKTYNNDIPMEILMPKPHCDLKSYRTFGNTLDDIKEKEERLHEFLNFIYGAEKVERTEVYTYNIPFECYMSGFYNNEWERIQKHLKAFKVYATSSAADGLIHFEFNNWNNMEKTIEQINNIKRLYIVKSPLQNNYKFKIRIYETQECSNKFKKAILNVIKNLDGKDMICRSNNAEIRIGKLSVEESDAHHLVFHIPCTNSKERKKADDILSFLANNTIIEATPALDNNNTNWLQKIWTKINGK